MSVDRSTGNLSALYREVILDHHRDPRNFGDLPAADVKTEGFNPLCGDRVEIFLKVDAKKNVSHLRFKGEGCSICMASASMMTEEIEGRSVSETEGRIEGFRALLKGESCPFSIEGDLESLLGVRQFPVRIKCALLPWTTLLDAVKKWKEKQ
jgi:nitrogen fixation NifU-like protein